MSNESQPTQQEKIFLDSQVGKIDKWDFDVSSPDVTRKFLSGLISETRNEHLIPRNVGLVEIPETLLPEEIKNELEKPYGPRIEVLIGQGPEWATRKEDRGRLVVMVQGQGYYKTEEMKESFMQDWSLYFTFTDNSVLVRDETISGINFRNLMHFVDKHKNDQKTLLKVAGKLVKASLVTQSASPQVLN